MEGNIEYWTDRDNKARRQRRKLCRIIRKMHIDTQKIESMNKELEALILKHKKVCPTCGHNT